MRVVKFREDFVVVARGAKINSVFRRPRPRPGTLTNLSLCCTRVSFKRNCAQIPTLVSDIAHQLRISSTWLNATAFFTVTYRNPLPSALVCSLSSRRANECILFVSARCLPGCDAEHGHCLKPDECMWVPTSHLCAKRLTLPPSVSKSFILLIVLSKERHFVACYHILFFY